MTNECETINVFCRLRPLDDPNTNSCIKCENPYTIKAVPPVDSKRNTKELTYTFSKIFDNNSSQSEVFDEVAYPLVNDLLNGKNGLLFAYGVTGSGKTYTMNGVSDQPGIVIRTIHSLFKRLSFIQRFRITPDDHNGFIIHSECDALPLIINERNAISRRSGNYECKRMLANVIDDPFDKIICKNCTVFISMVEICGNNVYDLLAKKGTENSSDIKVGRDCKMNYYFQNVKQEEVQTAEEALFFYLEGQNRRKTGATKLNLKSSRSHCVFNIRLVKMLNNEDNECQHLTDRIISRILFEKQNLSVTAGDRLRLRSPSVHCYNRHSHLERSQGVNDVLVTQLSLVDLAGSERAKRTEAIGTQLKEAGSINQSLMDLRRMIEALRKRLPGEKPAFKILGTCPLTKMFKTSFEIGSKVHILVCVQQKPIEYDETLAVLAFAEDAKELLIETTEINRKPFARTKITKVVPKMLTSPESETVHTIYWSAEDEACAEAIAREIDANQNRVENYRMVLQKEIDDPFEMAQTMVCLFGELGQIEKNRSQLESLFSNWLSDEDGDKVSELTNQLREAKNENNRLKSRVNVAEAAARDAKNEVELKEREMLERIKKLEAKNERLILKNLNDNCLKSRDSILAHPKKSVKVLAQKYEENINTTKSKTTLTNSKNRNMIKTPKRGFVNSRFRKSKSGEVFFEQKEKNEVPAGMLNRVALKNRRSSTKVRLDHLKKCDRYVLQNQTVTPNQFQTDYHKGNILPTAAGGVAVQFTDCETVIHHSPFHEGTNGAARSCKRHSFIYGDLSDESTSAKKRFMDPPDWC